MLEQETPKRAIKKYIEGDGPKDWKWQPIAKDLSAIANVFRVYFFPPRDPGDEEMPVPLFVGICEEIGLHPALGIGWHRRPADSQFARHEARYAIERLPHASGAEVRPGAKKSWWDDDRGGKPKGSSTLTVYTGPDCPKRPIFEKVPLGPDAKVVRISKAEMYLADLPRQQTGEPVQTWRGLARGRLPVSQVT